MNAKQIIRVTSTDPSDPFVKEVHTGQLHREEVVAYELEDGRVLHRNADGRGVRPDHSHTKKDRHSLILSDGQMKGKHYA